MAGRPDLENPWVLLILWAGSMIVPCIYAPSVALIILVFAIQWLMQLWAEETDPL